MASTENLQGWTIEIRLEVDGNFGYRCSEESSSSDLELESEIAYTKKDEAEEAARQAIEDFNLG